MILSSESFATNVTRIRSLIRVCPLVDQEVVRLGELTVAIFTNELFLWPRRPTWTSEQAGVVRGVECRRQAGLAEHVAHQQSGTDVGQHGLVRSRSRSVGGGTCRGRGKQRGDASRC